MIHVSYAIQKGQFTGLGSCTIVDRDGIYSMEDMERVRESIRLSTPRLNDCTIAIIHWQRFDPEPSPSAD